VAGAEQRIMSDRWFDHDNEALSDINVTPLVDVSLVLLIVFMITAPMMVQGASVQLPRTKPMNVLPQDQLIISVTSEGQVQVDGQAVPLEELTANLSPRVTQGRTVLVFADEAVPYGLVMQVIGIAHDLGADIGLPTEPIPNR
jgi:biopolymer transport protein ExbD